jgi:beta-N-acetylhexosaminidase
MSRDGSPGLPMQSLRRLGILSLWLGGIVLLVVGLKTYDPVLLSLRGPGNLALGLGSLAVVTVLLWRGGWRGRPWTARLLLLLWMLPSLAMLYAIFAFQICRHTVLQTEPALAVKLGQHFIVGYTSFPEVARLADKGLIGGIYVTKHNVAGRSVDAVRSEISTLQARRQAAHLPPLIVTADQEGGIVSHLSPLLPSLPPLSALAALSPTSAPAPPRSSAVARSWKHLTPAPISCSSPTTARSSTASSPAPPPRMRKAGWMRRCWRGAR